MLELNHLTLKHWFLKAQRDLPWRKTADSYAIWVSEIMLQQTQVSVVIPYYLKWMKRFPTVQELANAEIEEVIKMWEGLGYYSRARNLYAGARYLVENYNGNLPQTVEELSKIKGLGPYTIGAILSFAFHQKKATVDGNVLRVITRLYEIEEDITKASTQKNIRNLVEKLLPEEESWIVNEALIELGATICQRNPKCHICPLATQCKSYQNGTTQKYPVKSKGPTITQLYRYVFILQFGEKFLVKKNQQGVVMADLYEFPFLEAAAFNLSDHDILQKCKEIYYTPTKLLAQLPQFIYGFTRYKVFLSPYLLQVDEQYRYTNYEWFSLKELNMLPFSSGHRRILQHLNTLAT